MTFHSELKAKALIHSSVIGKCYNLLNNAVLRGRPFT